MYLYYYCDSLFLAGERDQQAHGQAPRKPTATMMEEHVMEPTYEPREQGDAEFVKLVSTIGLYNHALYMYTALQNNFYHAPHAPPIQIK